jgi:hypothetical protein
MHGCSSRSADEDASGDIVESSVLQASKGGWIRLYPYAGPIVALVKEMSVTVADA